MGRCEPFESGVEVRGDVVDAVLRAAGELSTAYQSRMEAALAEEGIDDPRPDEWYSQRAYLHALDAIVQSAGPQVVTTVGEQIPRNVDWPREVATAEDGLGLLNETYQDSHRGGDVGYYDFEQVAASAGRVFCKNPYPCALDRGVVAGVAEWYGENETTVSVTESGETCRTEGDAECVYRVSW
ncbi:hypothetical protein [Halorussus halophilus]|uniref:hypothetical protein n=1 Tax=Halorussus halophilus TaxID=2650975 RepID=UPI00130161E0|nr:hypothetical protein [Halorussus halophilus]